MKKKLGTILFILLIIGIFVLIWSQMQLRKADDVIAEADKIIEGETHGIFRSSDNTDIVSINSNLRQVGEIDEEAIDITWSYVPDSSDADKAREESILQDTADEVNNESEHTDVDSSADYSGDTWVDAWMDAEADTDYSEPVTAMTPPQTDVRYGFTDDEVYEIARIVWLEVGICGCSYYTQYLTACVILNRYLDWGYASLYDTIHADGQYATADMYTEYDGSSIRIGERTWSAVYDALADTDRNPHYQMRKGYEQRVYYSDPDWDVCFYY